MNTHSGASLFLLGILLVGTTACDGGHGVPFLASWSPDGKSVAFVPDHFNHRREQESGVWVLDVETGASRRIYEARVGWRCLQPQWSPSGDEVAFLLVGEGEEAGGKEERTPFSVWVVDRDGSGLRQVSAGETSGDGFGQLLLPGALAWGPGPGRLVVPRREGDRMEPAAVDLRTGRVTPLLPAATDGYVLQFSPSGEHVVVLTAADDSAEVRVSRSLRIEWRRLARVAISDPYVFWSADSLRFGVLGEESADREPSHFVQLFELGSGESRRIAIPPPSGRVLADRDGTALVLQSENRLVHLDLVTGAVRTLAAGTMVPLAWSPHDGRVYFAAEGKARLGQILSCAADGSDLRPLGVLLPKAYDAWPSPDGKPAGLRNCGC